MKILVGILAFFDVAFCANIGLRCYGTLNVLALGWLSGAVVGVTVCAISYFKANPMSKESESIIWKMFLVVAFVVLVFTDPAVRIGR